MQFISYFLVYLYFNIDSEEGLNNDVGELMPSASSDNVQGNDLECDGYDGLKGVDESIDRNADTSNYRSSMNKTVLIRMAMMLIQIKGKIDKLKDTCVAGSDLPNTVD